MLGQYQFYFNFYPTVDRWPVPTYEGNAVNDQGTNTLVVIPRQAIPHGKLGLGTSARTLYT